MISALALLLALEAPGEPHPVRPVAVAIEWRLPDGRVAEGPLVEELERLFRRAQVSFLWCGPGETAPIRVLIASRSDVPVVTGCRRGRHDHRLGTAAPGPTPGSGSIVLWVDHIARAAAADWEAARIPTVSAPVLSRAAARVLAHELGHVLLGTRDHRRRGFLKPSFSRHELTHPGLDSRFSDEDVAALARLAGSGAAAEAGR